MKHYIALALAALLVIAVVAFPFYRAYGTIRTFEAEVVKSEAIKVDGKTGSGYRIWTEDAKGNDLTLTVEDSILHWKFRSSDLYGKAKDGKTCAFTVYGWRVGFLSMYPNTLDIECP